MKLSAVQNSLRFFERTRNCIERPAMIDGNCGGKHAGSRTAWLPKALWIAVLAVLLSLPLEAAAEDEMHGQQKNKNYAVAPIVVSNPNIGTGAGATGMFFYDVGATGRVSRAPVPSWWGPIPTPTPILWGC
jgi:hypothetical protein